LNKKQKKYLRSQAMNRKKIAFFGAGNVGGTAAFLCAIRGLGDIVLVDTAISRGVAIGKALDIKQSLSLFDSDVKICGTSDQQEICGADVVIVLAGFPRKPGMSRDDLFNTNHQIIESIAFAVKTHAPESVVIMVTNPLDALTYSILKLSGFPNNRVMGMAGVLDSVRFQSYLSDKIRCSVKDIRALVLGSHGDEMVPVKSCASVNGIPVKRLLNDNILEESILKTRDSGGEFVKLMGTSAYFAAASSVVVMIESIIMDQKRILSCSAYLDGEYGIMGTCIGVPAVIGKDGVEKIIEISLENDELAKLRRSAEAVRRIVG
jgi:malate dehydrogenase